MITLKSDSDFKKLLYSKSYGSIIKLMVDDCLEYSQKFSTRENEWIYRLILAQGADQKYFTTFYGMVIHYQFRRLSFCFDFGISKIRIAETMDDFLDLYNEIQHDNNIINKQKGE